jgi:HAD superfamily hydrolase (TIGR01484 family)
MAPFYIAQQSAEPCCFRRVYRAHLSSDSNSGKFNPSGSVRSSWLRGTENAQEVFEAVHHLELEVGIVTNNKTIMVLPAGVNKATGLATALAELGIPARRVVAIGDGENDTALFEFAGCGVAVANAPTTVKSTAAQF